MYFCLFFAKYNVKRRSRYDSEGIRYGGVRGICIGTIQNAIFYFRYAGEEKAVSPKKGVGEKRSLRNDVFGRKLYKLWFGKFRASGDAVRPYLSGQLISKSGILFPDFVDPGGKRD